MYVKNNICVVSFVIRSLKGKLEVFRNQENKLKRNTTYFVKHENLA